mmetsp:Transcript_39090/g.39562  ORF Transcript_39090/g.39562 Transcript_39090/m.39562 type:complete len:241 (-) Transcript_39090:139-861(-)
MVLTYAKIPCSSFAKTFIAITSCLSLAFNPLAFISSDLTIPRKNGCTRRNVPSQQTTSLQEMKRPFFDQVATSLFNLEQKRVEESSVVDEKGRMGEPMEWSESGSLANSFSEFMAGGIGYQFKQLVADIVAKDFDEIKTLSKVDSFVSSNKVAMFSFSTCPFCRRAKDFLEEEGIDYSVIELDELDGNEGNEIRAVLGRKIRRTSVPSIFINGESIGGCNDGPGLLPLAKEGKLDSLLTQ